MGIGKEDAIRSRVVIQPRLRFTIIVLIRQLRRFLVGGREVALAVPSVARPVYAPERVVDGPYGIPIRPMISTRVQGGGRHPFEVGQDIAFAEELLPVGCLMCPQHRRVIFSLQPVPHLVRCDGCDLLHPFLEWL